MAVVALATGAGPVTSSHQPLAGAAQSNTAQVNDPEQLNAAALNDLQLLRSQLTFKALLPPGLALPPGHLYNRVVWAGAPVSGFGIFISSQDPAAGSRAIHLDEALLSAADLVNPRNPMNAFRSILQPVTLGNHVWYEMRQQHEPLQGEWILTTLQGDIAIAIDGLDSRELLERFAASIVGSR